MPGTDTAVAIVAMGIVLAMALAVIARDRGSRCNCAANTVHSHYCYPEFKPGHLVALEQQVADLAGRVADHDEDIETGQANDLSLRRRMSVADERDFDVQARLADLEARAHDPQACEHACETEQNRTSWWHILIGALIGAGLGGLIWLARDHGIVIGDGHRWAFSGPLCVIISAVFGAFVGFLIPSHHRRTNAQHERRSQ